MEFLLVSVPLSVLVLGVVQIAFLLAGKNAVDTAAYFAARRFSLEARDDLRAARRTALSTASDLCRKRPGVRWSDASLTFLSIRGKESAASSPKASSGDAYRLTLSHWVELQVPWVDRILFLLSPTKKAAIGAKRYLILQTDRWVTVE